MNSIYNCTQSNNMEMHIMVYNAMHIQYLFQSLNLMWPLVWITAQPLWVCILFVDIHLNMCQCVCDLNWLLPSALKCIYVWLKHQMCFSASFCLVMWYRVLSTVFLPGGNLSSNAARTDGYARLSDWQRRHWEFAHSLLQLAWVHLSSFNAILTKPFFNEQILYKHSLKVLVLAV